MATRELLTKEIVDDWKMTIKNWHQEACAWGAKSIILFYDCKEQEFKPLFVFPENSVPILARSLPTGNRAVSVIDLKTKFSIDEVITSICHFFDDVIEN